MALLVPHKSTLRDLFRFLLVFRLSAFGKMAFFFFCFFVLKNIFSESYSAICVQLTGSKYYCCF